MKELSNVERHLYNLWLPSQVAPTYPCPIKRGPQSWIPAVSLWTQIPGNGWLAKGIALIQAKPIRFSLLGIWNWDPGLLPGGYGHVNLGAYDRCAWWYTCWGWWDVGVQRGAEMFHEARRQLPPRISISTIQKSPFGGIPNAKFRLGSFDPPRAVHDGLGPSIPRFAFSVPPVPSAKKAQNSHQTNIPPVCQCFCGPLLQPLLTAPGWALRGWPSWRIPCPSPKRGCSDAEL